MRFYFWVLCFIPLVYVSVLSHAHLPFQVFSSIQVPGARPRAPISTLGKLRGEKVGHKREPEPAHTERPSAWNLDSLLKRKNTFTCWSHQHRVLGYMAPNDTLCHLVTCHQHVKQLKTNYTLPELVMRAHQSTDAWRLTANTWCLHGTPWRPWGRPH